MDQVKQKLKDILGREPSCSRLKDGKYMADYFKYGAPALSFVAETEEQAMTKLLDFLEKQPKTELP